MLVLLSQTVRQKSVSEIIYEIYSLNPKKNMLLIDLMRCCCSATFRITALPNKGDTIGKECFVQFLGYAGKQFFNFKRSNTILKNLSLQIHSVKPHTAHKRTTCTRG